MELNEEPLTFSQALNRLLQEKATPSSPWGGLEFKTEHNKYVLTIPEGEYYHGLASGLRAGLANVFRKLLELSGNGVDPCEANWFPFDADFSGAIQVGHLFFVVSDGEIADALPFCRLVPLDSEKIRKQGSRPRLAKSPLHKGAGNLLVQKVLCGNDDRASLCTPARHADSVSLQAATRVNRCSSCCHLENLLSAVGDCSSSRGNCFPVGRAIHGNRCRGDACSTSDICVADA